MIIEEIIQKAVLSSCCSWSGNEFFLERSVFKDIERDLKSTIFLSVGYMVFRIYFLPEKIYF